MRALTFQRLEGLSSASTGHGGGRRNDEEQVMKASVAGDPSTGEIRLAIEGMTCAHCAAHVDRSLRAIAGVREVRVDLASGSALVRVEPNVAPGAVVGAVRAAGYSAEVRG
jgi:copper chaperone CopZ